MTMERRPNLLLIVSDQHRADCLGANHGYPVHTPYLDRLAQEGVNFSEAYTPIPLCCPARQAFLNGRRPETFGALWNYDNGLPIPALESTSYAWPRELHNLGYRMAYLGKWHVHPEYDPTAYGYHMYVNDHEYEAYRDSQYAPAAYTNGVFGEVDPVPVEDSRTHWYARKTAKLISQYAQTESPWHIRIDFHEPHLPCRPSKEFASMFQVDTIPRWASFGDTFDNKPYMQRQQLVNWGVENMSWEEWAPIVARYYSMIAQMDDAIGHILNALEESGQAENTIVVYTSDHGDMCGGHRMMDKHYVMYDDIVKVPLIIRYPGMLSEGTVEDAFVYNLLDLPPTLLEWVGTNVPTHMQGRSMAELLQGKRPPDWRTEVVSTYNGQQFGLYTQRMIRNKHWKYVWNATDIDELYDLNQDPYELTNRIKDSSLESVVRDLRYKLSTVLEEDGDRLVAGRFMKTQLRSSRKLVE